MQVISAALISVPSVNHQVLVVGHNSAVRYSRRRIGVRRDDFPTVQRSGVDFIDTVDAAIVIPASERISVVPVGGDCHTVQATRGGAFQGYWLLPFRGGNVKNLNLRGLNGKITIASP